MTRVIVIVLMLLAVAFTPLSSRPVEIKIGSKKFTESVILGEMLKLLAEDAQGSTTHYRELGGTQLVFQALVNGDIDIYPEYTGTIVEEILASKASESMATMQAALKLRGVLMSRPLGYNNTYVLGMLKSRASELGINKISDLRRHPDLVFGFGNEFMDREDGWPNLQRRPYDLPQRNVSGLDHDLAYRQLKLGAIDVIDAYTTDAKIQIYDLALLEDDLNYFPRYDAVLLYRAAFAERFPDVLDSILRLEGRVSAEEMMTANRRVDLDRVSDTRVASETLARELGVTAEFKEETVTARIRDRTVEHLDLVRKSLIPAILIAIPLGILAAKHARIGQFILGLVGVVQTIPSLALLVILMPVIAHFGLASVGLGSATAVMALFLYSLLPIVRNTHAGL
ncbi:MAG: glycine betaine ABC transporter substrate-binding protein, partial [Pirellulaceae bacterium]